MRFAIEAEVSPVGVERRYAVEEGVVGALVEADRHHELEFGREGLETAKRRMVVDRARKPITLVLKRLGEIGCLEEFRQEDELRSRSRGVPDQPLRRRDVALAIIAAGEL